MPQSRLMTMAEKNAIGLKAFELKKQGKLEEYNKMIKQIPIPAYLAKFVKDHIEDFGDNFFEEFGFNLAEAEAEFGKDWLAR